MLGTGVVDKSCKELLEKSIAAKCWRDVLEKSVVEKCWEKCCREVLGTVL